MTGEKSKVECIQCGKEIEGKPYDVILYQPVCSEKCKQDFEKELDENLIFGSDDK